MKFFRLCGALALFSFLLACSSSENPAVQTEAENQSEGLQLLIPSDQWMKLNRKRDEAIEAGVLFPGQYDYCVGRFIVGGDTLRTEIKLKGKNTSSLQGDRWSYRMNLKGGNFNGKRSISIHSPERKGNHKEWVLHELMEYEGVLTTSYGFLPLTLNNNDMGVYAWEEHYEKALVESRNRREGPIVRFSDLAVLDLTRRQLEASIPFFELAEVLPYKASKTRKNPVLASGFNQANILMNQLRKGDTPLDQILDVQAFATYVAASKLFGNNHPLTWSELRFYFNPISAELEVVATNFNSENPSAPDAETLAFEQRVFSDAGFIEAYNLAVTKLKDTKYQEDFLASIDEKAKPIKEQLGSVYETAFLKTFGETAVTTKEIEQPSLSCTFYEPLASLGLRTYEVDSTHAIARNAHCIGIEILGYGNEVGMLESLTRPISIQPNNQQQVSLKTGHRVIYYRVENRDAIHSIERNRWSEIESKTTRQKLVEKMAIPSGIVEDEGVLRISGNMTFSKDVIIPPGYSIEVDAGSEITLNGAAWISYSPVLMSGTESDPILWKSNGAKGFTIMSPEGESVLEHVRFDGFGTLEEMGWTLTGAVNFYQANVELNHCEFANNTCEDALNIVDAEFVMDNCLIENTFGDGFDGDFTKGTVRSSTFRQTGNDCLDFSGSTIEIIDCIVEHSGDKGISGGEASTVTVDNINISDSHIAIASKDQSVVTMTNSNIENCVYGFAAFQKKSEFGPAQIVLEQVSYNQIDTIKIIDLNSVISFDGVQETGSQKLDVEALYGL